MGDIRAGAPPMIWNVPYFINQAMDNLVASATPIIYGNFDEYVVRVHQDMTMSFNDSLYWETGEVGFKAEVRADGKALQSSAFAKLPLKA